MPKVFDTIKAALQIAFSLVVLAIILLNFQGLYLATRKFLERAALVNTIKALGIEIDLGADEVDKALSLQNVAPDKKSLVLPMIQKLELEGVRPADVCWPAQEPLRIRESIDGNA